MSLQVEWDPDKAASNLGKHGVSFKEAATVFRDLLAVTVPDPQHSDVEDRFITVGISQPGRLLLVVHTEHVHTDAIHIRIISARPMTKRERKTYEEER